MTASRPYEPRPDQIESVMRRSGCSIEQARAVCIGNFRQWRDRVRHWEPRVSWDGGYLRVEVPRG